MKKLLIVLLLCVSTFSFTYAQNSRIYISKQGGTKNVFLFGKLGYNMYYFTNCSSCDSLICTGKGYESCKIEKSIIEKSRDQEKYKIYNKAIKITVKQMKKTNKESGSFEETINGRNVIIKYYNADTKGNADIEIEIQ